MSETYDELFLGVSSPQISPSIAVVLRRKNDCTWVRARGNQLIHRTAVREQSPASHPRPPSILSSSFSSSFTTIRVYLVGVFSLSLFPSIFLSYAACTRILVEIESREASLAWRSISFYTRIEYPASYADATTR